MLAYKVDRHFCFHLGGIRRDKTLDPLSVPTPCSQAANIPLVCELGIDKLSFDDFSLDVDAMVTAALRMFMELGMVQKFKIDYEVRGPRGSRPQGCPVIGPTECPSTHKAPHHVSVEDLPTRTDTLGSLRDCDTA